MAAVFHKLRSGKAADHPAVSVADYPRSCGPFAVVRVRDQANGLDSGEADLRSRLPVTPADHMITFTFANGCVATLRGSGTEPKLK